MARSRGRGGLPAPAALPRCGREREEGRGGFADDRPFRLRQLLPGGTPPFGEGAVPAFSIPPTGKGAERRRAEGISPVPGSGVERRGEVTSERPSLRAFVANRFWGRRRFRGGKYALCFPGTPSQRKRGQLSGERAAPSLPAKGTLSPGKGGAQCPLCLFRKGKTSPSFHRRPCPPLSPTAQRREGRTGKERTKKKCSSVVFVKNDLKKRQLRKQLEM